MKPEKKPLTEKKVLIIGAGIAGLSAGIYLQKAGIKTEIFEKHSLPGGQCTSWERRGFTFDGCIHWLVGSRPGRSFYRMWEDLGVLENRTFLNHDRYMDFRLKSGKSVTLYSNPDLAEEEFLNAFPEDSDSVKKFFKAVRLALKHPLPDPDDRTLSGFFKLLASLPSMIYMVFNWNISAKDFAAGLKNPDFADVIRSLFAEDFSMFFMILTLGWLADENAGYPLGGSLSFSEAAEKKYKEAGGTVQYRSEVQSVIVEDDTAKGIRLRDSSEHFGDFVIAATDGHLVIDQFLEGRYHNQRLKKAWETLPLFKPLFYLSLGLTRSLEIPHSVSGRAVIFSEPVRVPWGTIDRILVHSMDFDPAFTPQGKSCVSLMMDSDYDFWNRLGYRTDDYKKVKTETVEIILNALEKEHFPGLREITEVTDAATPLTWVHYTGVCRGAYEGLQLTPDAIRTGMSLPQKLHKLNNFLICGQWTEAGGGLPVAAASGRKAARYVNWKFRGKRPI